MKEWIPTSRLISIRSIGDHRGSLQVLESGKDIPFEVRRIYYLTGVPTDQTRGAHAHRRLQQVIVPIRGSFSIRLHDGTQEISAKIEAGGPGIFVGPMTWRELYDFSSDAVCLCLASDLYDEFDYIRNFDDFLMEVRGDPQTKVSVPFYDLRPTHDSMRHEFLTAVADVSARSQFILGPELQNFEKNFAAFCGVKEVVGVGSGLDALSLMLEAYGIGPGDEVLVPGYTFIATWLAVSRIGAVPVPVDVDEKTGLIRLDLLSSQITAKTKACIGVHLFGRMLNMKRLQAWGKRHKILIFEDAAQAHGASDSQYRAGAFSCGAAFSFYPTKNLGALGDGGAIATNDMHLARRLRLLRNYGSERKYEHLVAGTNSRLDEMQAAFLNRKLPLLAIQNQERCDLAKRYIEKLKDLEGLILPVSDSKNSISAWHLFAVRSRNRDSLQKFLTSKGIETMIHYPRTPYESQAFEGYPSEDLPVSNAWANEELSLPLFPDMTMAQQDRVIFALHEYFDAENKFNSKFQNNSKTKKSPTVPKPL